MEFQSLMWNWIRRTAQALWLYLVLTVAALALFYIAFNLSTFNLLIILAAAVVFGCLVTLFVAAQRPPVAVPSPEMKTTLLSPAVLVSEVRAAALVTYAQVGTISVRKERAKAEWRALDRLFGEELDIDVGVRVVAGVNLKHLREEDVRIEGNRVAITLPPTKVLMVYVDESLTRIVAHHNGWFTGHDLSMIDSARREAMQSMVNAVIEKDFFEKAGQQAAVAVAAIAKSLGYEEVRVTPTLPAIGQHFEELHDPATMTRIIAFPSDPAPREDQWSDG